VIGSLATRAACLVRTASRGLVASPVTSAVATMTDNAIVASFHGFHMAVTLPRAY